MIWQPFYDFVFALLEGSTYADFFADILSTLFVLMLVYILIIFPLQVFVRTTIRLLAAATGTPSWYSLKKKYNKPPKE